MAENVASRKGELWMSISVAPDVCKTPMGGSTPPVPYNVCAKMQPAKGTSENVHANKKQVHKHEDTVMPETKGDEPGTAKGVVSGTVGKQAWNVEKSSNVKANGQNVVRHDDKTEMNGDKDARDKADKKAKHKCRKEQVEAGRKSGDPATRAAADRLDKNIKGEEMGRLANDVYDPAKGGPTGWNNISDNRDALARHGLSPDQLHGPGGFQAQAYEPDPAVFGDDPSMRPTTAFRGTRPLSPSDWGANIAQGTGYGSSYYDRAIGIGTSARASGVPMDFTGHSLGGGLATAAARASGYPATTFNPAGLHSSTVPNPLGDPNSIDTYRVQGELLNSAQQSLAAPTGLGRVHEVAGSGSGLSRHGIGEAQKGIGQQIQQDQATIAANTGKKC